MIRLSAVLLLATTAGCAVPAAHSGGRPPMPGGWYGHQQPTVSPRSGPAHGSNTTVAAQAGHGAPYGFPPPAPMGTPQGGQAYPPPAAHGQAVVQPYQAPSQGTAAVAAPGQMPPAQSMGWGTPGLAAAAPMAHPEASQHWPHGAASGPQLDPWSAAPKVQGNSRLVLPEAASGAAEALGGAVKGIADQVTGARPVPPGSSGLDIRNVYDQPKGATPGVQPGTVTTLDGPARELELSGSGRLYLLEMYQQALEERDALEMEVGTLTARLEQMQAHAMELEQRLAAVTGNQGSLETQVAELRAENQDLAARLVTAQIRRLEAEKMLIEARIETERNQAAAGGAVSNAPAQQP